MVVEVAHHLPCKVEARRGNAMVAGAREELTAEIGRTQYNLAGRFIAPVAPEVRRDTGISDGTEVVVNCHLFPKSITGERGGAVAIGHAVPQRAHRRVTDVLGDCLAEQFAVPVSVDRHAREIDFSGLVRPRVELSGDSAVADEGVLVEIGCPDEGGLQRRRRGARSVESCAAQVGAADHANLAGRERLTSQPFDQVVAVLGLGAILKAAARTEGSTLPANVCDYHHIASAQKRAERQAVLEGDFPYIALLVSEASAVRGKGKYDRERFIDRLTAPRGTVDVDGKTGSVAHRDINGLAHMVLSSGRLRYSWCSEHQQRKQGCQPSEQ